MPFYKKTSDELLFAPNFVIGPNFELRAETHSDYEYPVDGWYWYENIDEALSKLSTATDTISMRQARLQLLQDGLLDDINAAVESLGATAKIEWEYASEIQKNNSLVMAIQTILNWDSQQVDQFFEEARKK